MHVWFIAHGSIPGNHRTLLASQPLPRRERITELFSLCDAGCLSFGLDDGVVWCVVCGVWCVVCGRQYIHFYCTYRNGVVVSDTDWAGDNAIVAVFGAPTNDDSH